MLTQMMKKRLTLLVCLLLASGSTVLYAEDTVPKSSLSINTQDLATYLLGTWAPAENTDTYSLTTFNSDGTWYGGYYPDASLSAEPTVRFAGTYAIDQDVITETATHIEPNLLHLTLPYSGKFKMTDISPDEHTSVDLTTGQRLRFKRVK